MFLSGNFEVEELAVKRKLLYNIALFMLISIAVFQLLTAIAFVIAFV